MALTASDSVPALVAGNAVVLKPDSQTPYCALACAELLYQAGLPRALYAIVPGPGSVVGTAIIENCDYLMFTGSTATGRQLAEHAGRRLIGFSAELGGKNAMIVTRGANLDKAAKAATRACFSNAGQLCISIERIYVEKDIDTEYGLNASVWAASTAEGQEIAARLRSGTVNVDEGYAFAWGSLGAPMGGMGQSGVGRRHGPEGLLKYTESQTIAAARVFNLDPPLGIPSTLWQKSLVPV